MRWLLTFLLVLLLPAAAAGQSWRVSRGDDGIKFGYTEAGSNNFHPIWLRCDPATRQIHVTMAVGERRPPSGQASATLDGITLAGAVGEFDFDGMFSLETTIPRSHPLLALTGDRDMTFTSGALRGTLKPAGFKAALQQFLAGCR
ncbi:MAG TPA: hypothetical protein VEC14_05130 [Reyranellaceae bacterium]|nr:hypothetical protein [Reyranellaceae bacterium]